MKAHIRNWSGRTELLVVLLVAFGTTVPRSLAALWSPDALSRPTYAPITNAALQGTVLYELAILCVLAAVLRARGWTLVKLGIRPTVQDSLLGICLFAGNYIVYVVIFVVVSNVWPQAALAAARIHLVGGNLDWVTIAAVSVTNPVFEEVFVCGYVITALKSRFELTTGVNVSAGIRVFYHFYQGALGVLGIVPMALIFAYWFGRTGRLWPLIVAHALQDFLALWMNSGGA